MVSAVGLLKTHRGLVNEVATQLAELNGISAVSYTHLDVYKRQVLYRPSNNLS